jgi:hypothetical protein
MALMLSQEEQLRIDIQVTNLAIANEIKRLEALTAC